MATWYESYSEQQVHLMSNWILLTIHPNPKNPWHQSIWYRQALEAVLVNISPCLLHELVVWAFWYASVGAAPLKGQTLVSRPYILTDVGLVPRLRAELCASLIKSMVTWKITQKEETKCVKVVIWHSFSCGQVADFVFSVTSHGVYYCCIIVVLINILRSSDISKSGCAERTC